MSKGFSPLAFKRVPNVCRNARAFCSPQSSRQIAQERNQMRADRYGDDVSNLCWVRKASAARSPPTTQLAMELPGGNARHDRPARNAKVVASGHGASPHLGGAGLMPVGYDGIADKILEFRTLQIFWHHLALRKGAKCGR